MTVERAIKISKKTLRHYWGHRPLYLGSCFACGKDFYTYSRTSKGFCSNRCGLAKHKRWYIDARGYRIRRRFGKPSLQHRENMQRQLKRKLKSNELVHHINHTKTDNRPNNLILVTNSENVRLNGLVWKYLSKKISQDIFVWATNKALKEIRNNNDIS